MVPGVERYKERAIRLYLRGDAAFASPAIYDYLEAEGMLYAIRLAANKVLQESIAHLLKRPVGRLPKDVRRYHASFSLDPSRKSGGALHRLHCFCLEFDGACEVQRRVPTDWIIEPIDVSGYGSFSLAS